LIAFVTVPLVDYSLTFVSRPDSPRPSPASRPSPPTPWPPVDRADLSLLASPEHRQILYRRPATVGEILFNYWD